MKKTLTLLVAAVAALSMTAANYLTTAQEAQMGTPVKMENMKKATPELMQKMEAKWASKLKATPNFPATTVDDLVGGYDYVYRQYTGGLTTQPDTLDANSRDQEDNIDLVAINKIDDSNIRITGMFLFPVQAEMGTSGNYTTFTIDDSQTVYYHSSYGACNLVGVWYYEGDDTYSAGWYYGDITGFIIDEGIIFDTDVNFYMIISSGTYANYRLGWIYEPGSYMLPDTDYNALMTYSYTSSAASSAGLTPTYDYPVIVSEDENYVVTVENFGGVADADKSITLTLAEDHTWAAAEDQVLGTTDNGDFVLYGTDGSSLYQLTGTGTETVLTFDSDWTGITESSYWYGQRGAATITRLDDDVFVYPTAEPEHAYYLIGGFNNWDQNNMVPFVENDGVYTLTYTFGGEFKVKDENGAWWGGGVTLTEENPSVTLVDGGNLNLDQEAEYTLTIEDGVLTVSGFPEPQVVEYNDFFVCGTFNGWSQETGLVELVANEEGTEFAGTVEFVADDEFKIITHNLAGGWKWFGGVANGNFMITSEQLGNNITLADGNNFQVEEAGSYDITVKAAQSKGLQEPLVMVITKTPTAISTIGTDVKADNAYYNLMGVKFNGVPTAAGIYIHNGRKVVIK